jgi:protein involved in polysaccharide export with SLBB domain
MRTFLLGLLLTLVAGSALGESRQIHPYDRVSFRSDQPEYCVSRMVTSDGYVYIPDVGPVPAAGMTLEAFEASLKGVLVGRGILASVRPNLVADFREGVSFGGAVEFTGSVNAKKGRRLSYVMSLARPTRMADVQHVQLIDAQGRTTVIDASTKGFAGSIGDPMIHSGDVVFVPLGASPSEVYVLGGVNHPGTVPYDASLTVIKAIALAGGISGHGDPAAVTVERGGKSLSGVEILEKGDVVKVGLATGRGFVVVEGAIFRPGVIEFRDGMTLTQVIDAAGGPSPNGDLSRVEVTSILSGRATLVSLKDILDKRAPDVVLVRSDVVHIPIQRVSP